MTVFIWLAWMTILGTLKEHFLSFHCKHFIDDGDNDAFPWVERETRCIHSPYQLWLCAIITASFWCSIIHLFRFVCNVNPRSMDHLCLSLFLSHSLALSTSDHLIRRFHAIHWWERTEKIAHNLYLESKNDVKFFCTKHTGCVIKIVQTFFISLTRVVKFIHSCRC